MKQWLKENKAAWLILAFIVGLVFMLSQEAKAESAMWIAPETEFIAGGHTEGTAIIFTEAFREKYEVSLILNVGTEDSDNNAGLMAMRIVTYKKFSMGLGGTLWQNETRAWSSNKTFALALRWNISEHWNVQHIHWSTGGSTERNGGLDMLMVGYYF